MQLVGGRAVELEIAGGGHHVGLPLREGLAGVLRFQRAEFVDAPGDRLAELHEKAAALGGGEAAHGPVSNAARAEATAASTSALPERGMVAKTAPSEGQTMSSVRPSCAGTLRPSTMLAKAVTEPALRGSGVGAFHGILPRLAPMTQV